VGGSSSARFPVQVDVSGSSVVGAGDKVGVNF